MKNLLLLLFVIGIVSCKQNPTSTETQQEETTVQKPTEAEPLGVIEYEDEDYSLSIEIDKFERSFIYGNAVLKNKKDALQTFTTGSFTCKNNGIEGVLYLTRTDGLGLEEKEGMTSEEIKEYFMKNYSKLMPLQKIDFQPNEEIALNAKINFSKPISAPEQTIIQTNSPSEK